ncbi:ABC transporter substrate-binding protein [Entomospira culicis]|uniref:ABC transporter substrate-binding protein n=1 Tax=Entomospira culicis TaxID=2719989 RepID=A0A968KW88_9SPIO|nr:ABC transporter substrate-binding protein [Entomospira culicis]NIZ19769.1 ABC transporter substrate-binding protein [Entomospira culicis]NIZ69983.1 ABC transporter substrate-binding protein [Entomospira culicis]WDI37088.1 ABC transporter substrate-binding protein [Entomospira culicis]WDI38717.1 ABC transporter substrate-binding protein [Entomospira culicis]
MMKKIAGILVLSMIAGCTPKGDGEDALLGRSVVDQAKREVAMVGTPRRVVSGFTYPYVSAWYVATGSGEAMVGMHPSSYSAMEYSILANLSPELLASSTGFIQQGELNVEELLKLEPDLYLENFAFGKNIEKMEELGLATIALKTMSQAGGDPFATMQSWLDLTAEITDANTRVHHFSELAQEAKADVAQRLSGVTDGEKPRVLMIHSHDERTIMVYGAGIWGNYWIRSAGGIDVAEEQVQGTQAVNMEQIYAWDPDIILISNFTETHPIDLLNNRVTGQDWSVLSAVQRGKVYKIPLGVYRWSTPSGDAPLMLKWMAQTLHPERAQYDMESEIRTYYQTFYGYSLNEQDLESILFPARESARSELTLYINNLKN